MSSKTSVQVPAFSTVSFQEVSADHAGQRLDNFLLSRLKGVPKSRIYRIIRKGEVRVNKKRAKPEYKLNRGDLVRIPPVRTAEPQEQLPPSEDLQSLLRNAILYEDEDLLVINKPAGLAVHGGTGVKSSLVEAMRHMGCGGEGLELVHRLDKGTSGCLMLAKNRNTLKKLSAKFKTGAISKIYHALVQGSWPADVLEVNAALFKHQPEGGERFVSVSRDGKSALTRFQILDIFPESTLVMAAPVTGRTHQIRVHAQLVGCPIIGDEKYADPDTRRHFSRRGIKRLCLHAFQLSLEHPMTGVKLLVQAPYDKPFESAVRVLQQAVD